MALRQLDILLYPPSINIILLLLALFLWKKRKTALSLIAISTITLFIFSLPITSHNLAVMLEKYPAIPPAKLIEQQADAIVLLGGGSTMHADEYQSSSLTDTALTRLRYAAFVRRQTGLPLLVTGNTCEAEAMQRALGTDYRIFNVRAEANSKTTAGNAINAALMLKQKDKKRIFLVTSSLHMNRSVALFSQQGLDVIPAPTDLYSDHDIDWRYYVPSGDALQTTRHVLHEYMGLLWHWFRGVVN